MLISRTKRINVLIEFSQEEGLIKQEGLNILPIKGVILKNNKYVYLMIEF
jgi:hypothetical protein